MTSFVLFFIHIFFFLFYLLITLKINKNKNKYEIFYDYIVFNALFCSSEICKQITKKYIIFNS